MYLYYPTWEEAKNKQISGAWPNQNLVSKSTNLQIKGDIQGGERGRVRAIIIGYTRNIRSHFSRKNEDFFTICDTNLLGRKPEPFDYVQSDGSLNTDIQ